MAGNDDSDSDATISDFEDEDGGQEEAMEIVNSPPSRERVPASSVDPSDQGQASTSQSAPVERANQSDEPSEEPGEVAERLEEPGQIIRNGDEPGEVCELLEPGELAIPDQKRNREAGTLKRSHDDSTDKDDQDDGSLCPICMDMWTNSGNHRLACLRCGHLFGHSCIVRWLNVGCSAGQRRCPQCNKRAALKDIRFLYARKLQVLDTAERDQLKKELEALQMEKNRLELELVRAKLNSKMQQLEVEQLKIRLIGTQNDVKSQLPVKSSKGNFTLRHTLEICKNEGCRVLAFCGWYNILCISQSSANRLFSGFGIKKIDAVNMKPTQFLFLHPKPIRDLSFSPHCRDMLLSVSVDNSAKLVSVLSNTVVHSLNTEAPLWSCCWDADNSNQFYVGSQKGVVMLYDVRQPQTSMLTLSTPGDKSPVTSVVSVPTNRGKFLPRGGLLVCRLNSVWTYKRLTDEEFSGQQAPLDGPFTSLCYEPETELAMVSTRPNARFRQTSHILCQLDIEEECGVILNPIHTYLGSTSQKLLSRPCQVVAPHDTYVAAHLESNECISIWSASTRECVQKLRTSESIIDLCPLKVNDTLSLAALSPNSLQIYTYA
ncbi:E3 ubiquitin-protein ligase rfwd3.L [Anabrus simplex]|uniref:E3 ubiquitin-protein ligase rfwd3.L n=1 Tax=Anabrus simplex TaxID=316456 RepID=UPI0034DD7B6F